MKKYFEITAFSLILKEELFRAGNSIEYKNANKNISFNCHKGGN